MRKRQFHVTTNALDSNHFQGIEGLHFLCFVFLYQLVTNIDIHIRHAHHLGIAIPCTGWHNNLISLYEEEKTGSQLTRTSEEVTLAEGKELADRNPDARSLVHWGTDKSCDVSTKLSITMPEVLVFTNT